MVIQELVRTFVPWSQFIELLEEELEGIISAGEEDGEGSDEIEDAINDATLQEPTTYVGLLRMEDAIADATPQKQALPVGLVEMEYVIADAAPQETTSPVS